MKKHPIGLLGVTGYTGYQLLRMLRRHPAMELVFATSEQQAGKTLREIFPNVPMNGPLADLVVTTAAQALEVPVEGVFSCLPHAAAAEKLLPWIQKGIAVVDLSADFRMRSPERYAAAYHSHPNPELLPQAVYGLVEDARTAVQNSKLIGNPGCYPTSVLLPLLPLVRAGLIELEGIIADSKSGVSGAGKAPTETTHFCEVQENFSAYKPADEHRHLAEIDEQLSLAAGCEVGICFTPHLLPMSQGILSTLYVRPKAGVTEAQVRDCWQAAYGDAAFVEVLAQGLPKTGWVRGTNRCVFGLKWAFGGRQMVIVSVIDNLIKGASGQALQNMNLVLGIDESAGLEDLA
jgi:N-acetyl-gamma-glutamyl-phosphate reductase